MRVFTLLLLGVIGYIELRAIFNLNHKERFIGKIKERFQNSYKSMLIKARTILFFMTTVYITAYYLSGVHATPTWIRWFSAYLIIRRLQRTLDQWYALGTANTAINTIPQSTAFIRAVVNIAYIACIVIWI